MTRPYYIDASSTAMAQRVSRATKRHKWSWRYLHRTIDVTISTKRLAQSELQQTSDRCYAVFVQLVNIMDTLLLIGSVNS